MGLLSPVASVAMAALFGYGAKLPSADDRERAPLSEPSGVARRPCAS